MKNKPLTILMSVLVAFGLWLYVITVVSPESEKTYYEIPVVIQSKNILAERDLMIVSEEPKVTLELKSSRTILNSLNEANINVITSVANIEKPGTYNLTYSISYPGNIADNEISVQKSSTDLITVTVENRVTKQVDVEIDYNGTAVPMGYEADTENPVFDDGIDKIEISGPESVVSQIDKAVIDVDLTGKTTKLVGEYQFTLCNGQDQPVNAEKITVNKDKVFVSIDIYRVKELPVAAPNIKYGNGVTEDNCKVIINPAIIKVGGSDAALENLTALTYSEEIDLRERTEDDAWTVKVEDLLPQGVKNLSGVETITIFIDFTEEIDTTSIKITVSENNVQYINFPANIAPERVSDVKLQNASVELSVTVRGSKKLVDTINKAKWTVKIDVSALKEGASAPLPVPVLVEFQDTDSDKYSSLGTKVEGTVLVKLAEKK